MLVWVFGFLAAVMTFVMMGYCLLASVVNKFIFFFSPNTYLPTYLRSKLPTKTTRIWRFPSPRFRGGVSIIGVYITLPSIHPSIHSSLPPFLPSFPPRHNPIQPNPIHHTNIFNQHIPLSNEQKLIQPHKQTNKQINHLKYFLFLSPYFP